MEAVSAPPLAYDVRQLQRVSCRGRTAIFADIAAGRLKARRVSGKLLILHEDAKAWLHALPVREPSSPEAALAS